MKVKGFALIELLITLIVLSIILSLTSANLYRLLAENRLATQQNTLTAAIALARNEAIKRGQRIVVCQSEDNLTCTKASRQWHLGWIIYTDINANNQVDTAEIIIHAQQVISKSTLSFGARTRVAFHPNGYAVGASNGTFIFCDTSDSTIRTGLIISFSGRPRVARPDELITRSC